MDTSTEERVDSLFQTKEHKVKHTYRWLGGFALGFTAIIMVFFPIFGDRSGLDYIQEALEGDIDKNIAVGAGGNWTINGNTVYINDQYVYLSATPHTLGSSGWVEFSAISKQYEGDVDVIWGFNSTISKPKQPQVWKNYTHYYSGWHMEEVYQNVTIKNVTAGINLGMENYDNYTVNYGNKNNTKLWQINYTTSNATLNVTVAFLSQQHQGNNYRFYFNDNESVEYFWNETFFDWKDADLDFTIINRTFRDVDTWYLLTQYFQQNREYKIRAWIDIPFGGLNGTEGKYWWAMKRSDETLEHAIQNNNLYYLDPWWDSSWTYSKKIIIDHTKVAGDETNFPVLIQNTSSDFADHARADGYDFRVVSSDNTTEYHIELVDYDSATGALNELWCNVTSLSGDTDTVLWLYYGNAGADTDPSSTDTWDSHFKGVWHMNDTSGGIVDSTGEGNDGTEAGDPTYLQAGKMGGAIDFDGSGDYFTLANDVFNAHAVGTIESWVKRDSTAAQHGIFGAYYNNVNFIAWWIRATSGDQCSNELNRLCQTGGTWRYHITGDVITNDGNWHSVALQVDAAGNRYYIAGNLGADSDVILGNAANPQYFDDLGGATTYYMIGSSWYSNTQYPFNGWIDEVRVSDTDRSANWLSTTYATQNAPDTFASYGSEQSEAPANTAPVQSNPLVWDGTTAGINHSGVIVPPVSFNITINDADGDKMTLTVRTNESGTWQDVNTSGNLDNGTYSNNTNVSWVDSYNTKYWISFNVTDGTDWDNNTYYFTTKANTAPVNSNPYPSDTGTDIPLVPSTINITVADVDDAEQDMTITFRTNESGTWQDADTNVSVSNGTYYCLNTSWVDTGTTKYWWSVNTTDSCGGWDNDTYSFTTASNFTNGDGTEEDPYQITNCEELNWTRDDLTAYYILMNNIDMADCGVENWNGGEGFIPIGNDIVAFTGSFDGQNFSISNLFINRPSDISQGLFGEIGIGTIIKNLSLIDVNVTGNDDSGGLVGYDAESSGTIITNCSVTGIITGASGAGGLIGSLAGTIIDCYVIVEINAIYVVGGLAGYNDGTIENCYSTGLVTSDTYAGGLVGDESGSVVIYSYWDNETSGQTTSDGGTGRTTAQMTYDYEDYDPPEAGLYEDWDLADYIGDDSIWVHDNGNQNDGYPLFRWQYVEVPLTWHIVSSDKNGTYSNSTTYHLVSSDKNGTYSNTTNWVLVDSIINGSYSNTTQWIIVDSTINGSYINTTIKVWNVVDNTINGSYTNSTIFKMVSSDKNGSYINTTKWKIISSIVNGSYTNTTIWAVIDSSINGSYSNTTIWNVIIDTINGTYTNTTIKVWNVVDTTINGTYINTTAFKTVSSIVNGTYQNTTSFKIISSDKNGSYTNTTTWNLIDSSINGTYTNTTQWNIITNVINGSYINTTIKVWNVVTDTVNGSYSNTTTWHTVDSTINGTYTNTTPSNITITNEYPHNNTYDIPLQPTSFLTIQHAGGYTMNITFYYGNSTANCTTQYGNNTNINNGTYNHLFINATTHGTTYYWKVIANDGTDYHNETFLFTTESNINIIQTPGYEILTFLLACLVSIILIKRRQKKNDR